jgi:hypothetical protein
VNLDPEVMRKTALVVSAALRDDDVSVRHLLHTLPDRIAAATTEACLLAMAELVRQFVPPHAIQAGIADAQQIAHEAATGRNHP